MEGYVLFANIVMGIIQMFCLNYEGNIKVSAHRYLRTPSQQVISEASMMKYLGRNLFRFGEPGKVFHNHAVDFPAHHIGQEPLEVFAVGIRPGVPIVHIFNGAFKFIHVPPVEIPQQVTLVLHAVAVVRKRHKTYRSEKSAC